uniref:NADH-ubiquinone oxidoreductase chain 6 n=1 Tax=Engaeus lyelli TaxID=219696 RepID=W6MUY2_9EUCA|nr:NADH dehydrogenase subunit 6 [Engaeus lyelli]CDL72549.1 NADH dehydrogenase subunit 6 [Engaeus lyelli]
MNEILYFLLPTLLSLSLLFSQLTHPLSMGVVLLMQTILVCLLTGIFNPCFWFSYILFLIFLGAMLILFIYIASLASNESFKIHFLLISALGGALALSLTLLLMDPLPLLLSSNPTLSETTTLSSMPLSTATTNMIYSPHSGPLTSLMILYLLLTLIVIVKIISPSGGPLRPST